jgi:FixJ family two-component response regulator
MAGSETFQTLRQLSPRIPVLFSSGYSQTEVNQQWLEDTAATFVAKPYQAETLLTAVRQQMWEYVRRNQPDDTLLNEGANE